MPTRRTVEAAFKAKVVVMELLGDEDDGDDTESLAADFIEDVIGHYHFPDNWKRHRDRYLPELEQLPNGHEIIAAIDKLASENANWTDAYKQTTIELE